MVRFCLWQKKLVSLAEVENSLRICLLTRSLDVGGAERQIVLLANLLTKDGHQVKVISMYDQVALATDLDEKIELCILNKSSRWEVLSFFMKLSKEVSLFEPNFLYSFLVLPNIIAVILKLFHRRLRVIWGIRASNVNFGDYDMFSRLSFHLCALLSPVADLLISNSYAGADSAKKAGFKGQIHVVHNGIDLSRYQPDENARARFRARHALDANELVLACAARLDPMKGVHILLSALNLIKEMGIPFKFVCAGKGETEYKKSLVNLAFKLGIEERVLWISSCSEMVEFYNGIDILISSSVYGEGFSNSIAEAMACNKLVVSTRVGDSAVQIQDETFLCQPDDSKALAMVIQNGINRLPLNNTENRVKISEFSARNLLNRTLQTFSQIQ